MVWTVSDKVNSSIQSIIDKILSSEKISRRDHLQLASAILADHQITDQQRRQINRVFDYVQTGRLKLVD